MFLILNSHFPHAIFKKINFKFKASNSQTCNCFQYKLCCKCHKSDFCLHKYCFVYKKERDITNLENT